MKDSLLGKMDQAEHREALKAMPTNCDFPLVWSRGFSHSPHPAFGLASNL